jgi:predicted ribonuclease YlaK
MSCVHEFVPARRPAHITAHLGWLPRARIRGILITPTPGTDLRQAREALSVLSNEARNLHSVGQTSGPGASALKLWAYLEWVRKAERTLSNVISRSDTAEILNWGGYENLMVMAPSWAAAVGGNPQERILHALMTDEITKRVDSLEAARVAVEAQATTWGGGFSQTVVFDTSVYLSYREKLEDIDWAGFQSTDALGIRLAVPMVVIDELDATKSDDLRGRANYSLAVLDKVLRRDSRLKDAPVEVEVKLLSDPMGHRRLPINDQEIIARTLSLQAAAQSPVTLLTCDTGMALRAREVGLSEIKLERRDPKEDKRKTRSAQSGPNTVPASHATPPR